MNRSKKAGHNDQLEISTRLGSFSLVRSRRGASFTLKLNIRRFTAIFLVVVLGWFWGGALPRHQSHADCIHKAHRHKELSFLFRLYEQQHAPPGRDSHHTRDNPLQDVLMNGGERIHQQQTTRQHTTRGEGEAGREGGGRGGGDILSA